MYRIPGLLLPLMLLANLNGSAALGQPSPAPGPAPPTGVTSRERLEERTSTVPVQGFESELRSIQQREPDASQATARRITPAQGPCVPPPPDLVLWLPLDSESAGKTLELAKGATASLQNGVQAVGGKVAGAFKFDGQDDFVEIAAADATGFEVGAGDLTIDAWVKLAPTDRTSGVRVLVEKRQPSPLRGYSLFLYDGRPGLQLAAPSGYSNYIADAAVPADGQWHLVAVTVVRNGEGRFYVDGTAVAPAFNPSGRAGDLNNRAPLRLGSTTLSPRAESVLQGALDEAEVFRRALRADEIAGLYRAGSAGKCKFAAIKIRVVCDNGKTATFEVDGVIAATKVVNWVTNNCDSSVTVYW